MTDRILYIATGEEYVDEAHISARSLKRYNDYPVEIITNRLQQVDEDIFDLIIPA